MITSKSLFHMLAFGIKLEIIRKLIKLVSFSERRKKVLDLRCRYLFSALNKYRESESSSRTFSECEMKKESNLNK